MIKRPDWKTVSEQRVYSCRVFEVYEETLDHGDGKQRLMVRVAHPGAVVVVPVTAEGNIVLVEQYRRAIDRVILELPAGTLEPQEEPLTTAQRELAEEAELEAQEWHALGSLYPAPGFCTERQYGFIARGLSAKTLPQDEDEVLQRVEMSFTEVQQAIESDRMQDAKSIAFLYRALLQGYLKPQAYRSRLLIADEKSSP